MLFSVVNIVLFYYFLRFSIHRH